MKGISVKGLSRVSPEADLLLQRLAYCGILPVIHPTDHVAAKARLTGAVHKGDHKLVFQTKSQPHQVGAKTSTNFLRAQISSLGSGHPEIRFS